MAGTKDGARLVLCCEKNNDLLGLLRERGVPLDLASTPTDAVKRSPRGGGVLVLADGYLDRQTSIDAGVFEEARSKGQRLYIEYPAALPDLEVGASRTHRRGIYNNNLDREVIASDAFGFGLRKLRIVLVHGCRYVPIAVEPGRWHIVTARVCGCDTAVFGLPTDEVWPILFEHPSRDILVATTKISHFRTGRYAPTDAWPAILSMILRWVAPGREVPDLTYTATVRPSFGRSETLPPDAHHQAMERGIRWFAGSGLFIDPSGKEGFKEGFSSREMYPDGSQAVSTQVRTDCHGEVALTLALGSVVLKDPTLATVAANLLQAIYVTSPAAGGPRLDPSSPSYGLIGGDMKPGQSDVPFDLVKITGSENLDGAGVYYGDDYARHFFGAAAAAAILRRGDWDERMLMECLANFRTTGPWGFRKARLEEPELHKAGWRQFWDESDGVWEYAPACVPHYQAYPWSANLWLYHRTGFEPLLTRTERGIRNLMNVYPDGWGSEGNRHETERCRMLLPLAWLLRVDDTAEHREWLQEIVRYVLDAQHASGAIRHRLIEEVKANEKYGTLECALIQSNGEPVTDLLYATNFAFVGLHEVAAVTKDPEVIQAEERLADFLVRIQIRGETRPELDGGWYRGFDFRRWDYWGADGDVGWGVWSIETGWTVGWIDSVLAMREMGTNLWDLMDHGGVGRHMDRHRPEMLPNEALTVPLRWLR
jgi:hypothetical protein